MAQTDPYHSLGLPHGASDEEIKRAYRKLAMKLHPDHLIRSGASAKQVKDSIERFAEVSAAYTLLSDPARKRQYDHIYKFGGYDDVDEARHSAAYSKTEPAPGSQVPKSKKGVGYKFTDPISYLMSQGKVRSETIAGISIPSRFGMCDQNAFQVSISSGKAQETSTGSVHCRSTTLTFSGGRKMNKVETVHLDRHGRKETLIQGDDYIERRYSTARPRRQPGLQSVREGDYCSVNLTPAAGEDMPWHERVTQAYRGITENMQRCTKPPICGEVVYRK